jgi:mycothiol synthase
MTTMADTRWIELEGAPPIPGLRARRWRDDADYALLTELMNVCSEEDQIPWVQTPENLKIEIEGEDGIDAGSDIVIVEVDGQVVAEAQVWRAVRDGVALFDVGGNVLPAFRRRGIGRALLQMNLRRAAERAAIEPKRAQINVETFAEDTETGHRAILAAAGFETVRHFFLMRVPSLDHIPDAPMPEGIEVRPVTTDHHRPIFDAEAEAFKDHWGHREQGDDLFRTMYAKPELDTSLWVVAWDGDEIAGVVQNWIWAAENERLGVKRGWLERISVGRPWRRRGLGRAITAAALRRLREAGMEDAMLGVDSENPTGALSLYESVGFTVHSSAAAYRRPLER